MHDIKSKLETIIGKALADAAGVADCSPMVIYTKNPKFGDYQANGVMGLAKKLRIQPRDLAAKVLEHIDSNDFIGKTEIAGPGFINITIDNKYLQTQSSLRYSRPGDLISTSDTPSTVVVDYSAPNLAKEMHVGHLRGTIIGDCIVRVLEATGHQVIRQNHVGDWGTQFGMLIAYMEHLGDSEEMLNAQLSDLERFYRSAKQKFDTDPEFADMARSAVVTLQQGDGKSFEIWEKFIAESLHHCEAIYEQLGITLKREDLRPESSYNNDLENVVKALDKSDLLTLSDGAKCVFLPEFQSKDGTPLGTIVQKSDGGYLYATTDLAAVRYRAVTLKANRVLYVVDARQGLHFQQVFAISRLAGFCPENMSLEHLAYGTMMGKDGKPFKTRSGDTIKLKELLDEAVNRAFDIVTEKSPQLTQEQRQAIANVVGISAVKYADLSKNRTSDYVFDWSTMLAFEGNTAPYMLYAYARIRSILRKHNDHLPATIDISLQTQEERNLAIKNLQFPEVIQIVATDCYPNHLSLYLYELAGIFMRFYEACPILKAQSELRESRLALADLTANTLQQGLDLLGIETLEQM